jgi:predicted DNA-binding transcriptional regulator YafY
VGPPSWAGPTVDAAALTVIAQACRDQERLGYGYTRRDGEQARRVVEPHRLVMLDRRWYLVAWDTERRDWRSFRVDRMTNPAPTGARFPQRDLPGGDAAAFVQAGIAAIPMRYQVAVTVHAPAPQVAALVRAGGTVEPVGAASCQLRMSVDSLDWPVMVLSAVGAEFEIGDPPELTEHIRTLGARFARCAGRPGARVR